MTEIYEKPVMDNENPEQVNERIVEKQTSVSVGTTDTGYHHEDVLKKYVDIAFYIGIAIIVLLFIFQVYNARGSFEMVLGALVINVLYGLLLYVFRSFVYVFRNISINLHEMNMKMKEKA